MEIGAWSVEHRGTVWCRWWNPFRQISDNSTTSSDTVRQNGAMSAVLGLIKTITYNRTQSFEPEGREFESLRARHSCLRLLRRLLAASIDVRSAAPMHTNGRGSKSVVGPSPTRVRANRLGWDGMADGIGNRPGGGSPLENELRDAARVGLDSALRFLASQTPLEVRVKGECMSPLVLDGDRVLVAPRRCYLPGDILVFRDRNGVLVSHRLLGWFPRHRRLWLLTQADSAILPDPPVAPGQVLGRIVGGASRREAVRVPLGHRIRAARRFLAHVLRRVSRACAPGHA